MKASLIQLFQNRMDKCTYEQWWVTAATAALNLATSGRGWGAWVFCGAVSVMAIRFVVSRHHGYYKNRANLAEILQDIPEAPGFLKTAPHGSSYTTLSGVSFYCWLILGTLLIR
jgi:hypothetical protein